MKFIYTVSGRYDDSPIISLPCPYIIDDFAKSFLQQFIKNHKSIRNLPDGMYIVKLYKDILPAPLKSELFNTFKKDKEHIEFFERPYGL